MKTAQAFDRHDRAALQELHGAVEWVGAGNAPPSTAARLNFGPHFGHALG